MDFELLEGSDGFGCEDGASGMFVEASVDGMEEEPSVGADPYSLLYSAESKAEVDIKLEPVFTVNYPACSSEGETVNYPACSSEGKTVNYPACSSEGETVNYPACSSEVAAKANGDAELFHSMNLQTSSQRGKATGNIRRSAVPAIHHVHPGSAYKGQGQPPTRAVQAAADSPLLPHLNRSDSRNTVQKCTFISWNVSHVIGSETKEEQGKEVIARVWCKLCAKYSSMIRAAIRGKAAHDMEKYISGTSYVTKHTVMRHINHSKAHDSAEKFEAMNVPPAGDIEVKGDVEDIGKDACSSSSIYIPRTPPVVDSFASKEVKEAYGKLFTTAYIIAMESRSLKAYGTAVRVQKANGVHLPSGCESSKRAEEMIAYIAAVMREKLRTDLMECVAFALLADGSQGFRTRSEKESVYVRLLRDGRPQYFFTALQDIDDFGGTGANSLKVAIDQVFEQKLGLEPSCYSHKLVCAASDGSSNNTELYNGLLTQLGVARPWLLRVRSVVHRAELAVKEALLSVPEFKEVEQFMTTLWYAVKNSENLHSQLKLTASTLNVHFVKFRRLRGTQFIGNQLCGVQALLHNYIVLLTTLGNLASQSQSSRNPILSDLLKTLQSTTFLRSCTLYLVVLEPFSEISKAFKTEHLLISDMKLLLSKLEDKLSLLKTTYSTATELFERSGVIPVSAVMGGGDRLSIKSISVGQGKEKGNAKERSEIKYEGMCDDLPSGSFSSTMFLETRARRLLRCFQAHFASFINEEIYEQISCVLDPSSWVGEDAEELNRLMAIAERFNITLSLSASSSEGITVQSQRQLKEEWQDIKRLIRQRYRAVDYKRIWENILSYKRHTYPLVCSIVELCLVVGVTNATVESGFTHLNAMLTDVGHFASHETMENLLMIKTNSPIYTTDENNAILAEALDNFMAVKKRRSKLEDTVMPDRATARKRAATSLTENSSSSECDSDESSSNYPPY